MKKTKIFLSYIFVGVIALAIATVFIHFVGCNISEAFKGFIMGIFSTKYAIGEILVKTIPLTLCGLGISIGFRSGFINLGAEGQLYMGAIAGISVGLMFSSLPSVILIPLMILAGFILGGIWAIIPGFLKGRFGISEIIVTIMFNYIAINIVGVLLHTILKDPLYPYPVSPKLGSNAILPLLMFPTRLHAGLIIAFISAALVYVVVWKTPVGYQMRAVGLNPRASKCSGISVYKNIIIASLLSGGLAGISGMTEISGVHRRLLQGISPDYGYIAIIVALLGKNHPLGVVIAALGIAMLQVGSLAMQRMAGVPTAISYIIMGTIVLLILARGTIFHKVLVGIEEN